MSSGKLREATLDFGAVPGEGVDVVVRGAMLADVANQARLAVDALLAHEAAEEIAAGANERPAMVFFLSPGASPMTAMR